MKNSPKLLIGLVLVLIAINIALMIFIWRNHQLARFQWNQPEVPRHEMQGFFFKQKLNLSNDQAQLFKQINQEHRERMVQLNRQLRIYKSATHRNILSGDSANRQTTIDSILFIHMQIENETGRYLGELSAICDDNQREKLKLLLDEALPTRGPGPGHRH